MSITSFEHLHEKVRGFSLAMEKGSAAMTLSNGMAWIEFVSPNPSPDVKK